VKLLFRMAMTMRNFIIVIICCLTSTISNAQFWIEGSAYPATGTGFGTASAVDNYGNVYRGGLYTGTIDFRGILHASGSNRSLYLTKHDANDSLLWALQFQTTSSSISTVYDIKTDANGFVYLAGMFDQTITFDTITVNAVSNTSESFVAKFYPHGKVQWVNIVETTAATSNQSVAKGVVIDDQGNCYVGGSFKGTGDFNGIQLISSAFDGFVAKYDNTGDIIYVKKFGGSTGDGINSISLDHNNEILICGLFTDTVFFNTDTLVNIHPTESGSFFARFDAAGNEVSAHLIPGIRAISLRIYVDALNDIYVGGVFRDSVVFPTTTFYTQPTNGYNDSYLAKYTPGGNLIWARHMQGKLRVDMTSLIVTSSGSCYVTGEHRDSSYFDTTFLAPPTGSFYSIFVAKCDRDGNFLWTLKPALTGGSEGLSITAKGPKIYMHGYSSGTTTFGPDQITESGTYIVLATVYDSTEVITTNTISGSIHIDIDSSCTTTIGDYPMSNILVKASPGPYYSITDSSGDYTIGVNTDFYTVEQIIPPYLHPSIDSLCPLPNVHTVAILGNGIDTASFDFYNAADTCINLNVDVTSSDWRLCTNGTTVINYCNNSWFAVSNVIVYLDFMDTRILQGASHNYSITVDSTYAFNIGTLQPGECGTITINDSITCDVNFLGFTDCTKAWITPHNCPSATAGWDLSDVNVGGECNAGFARFTIKNDGIGNMSDSTEIRVFKDAILIHTQNYKLAAGDSIVISIQASGLTVRLEADQTTGHPYRSQSNATVETCDFGQVGPVSLGFVVPFPQDDEAPYVSISCFEIVGAYDPNIKQVFPTGITTQHYVHPNQELKYLITFQNTGTDTAYDVHLIDTLPVQIDPASLRFGASSHPYTVDISGGPIPIIQFNFDSIYLPDSNVNAAGSIGFVQFYGSPYDHLPNGTVVENFADIYFDFNPPIRTDTPWVTLFDTTFTGIDSSLIVEGPLFAFGDTQICKGELVSLTAVGDSLLWWSLNGTDTIATGINLDMGFNSDTTIYLFSDNDSLAIAVEVSETPTFNLGSDTIICQGQLLILSGSSIYDQFLWNTGDTTQSIMVDTSGSYTLTVQDSNQCIGSDNINVQVLDCTGILEQPTFNFTFSPNPASNSILIQLSKMELTPIDISIYNSEGKLVIEKHIQELNSYLLDISALNSGSYILSIQQNGIVKSARFIIQ
jgi:uncharacterized repeat protein (TIGR01451 family)